MYVPSKEFLIDTFEIDKNKYYILLFKSQYILHPEQKEGEGLANFIEEEVFFPTRNKYKNLSKSDLEEIVLQQAKRFVIKELTFNNNI